MARKLFSQQLRECREKGYLIEEEHCYNCGMRLLICKKYGGQCYSRKCREERIKEE